MTRTDRALVDLKMSFNDLRIIVSKKNSIHVHYEYGTDEYPVNNTKFSSKGERI